MPYWSRSSVDPPATVGNCSPLALNSGDSRCRMRSVSPLANADKLKAPVLLAYGGSDNRVPIKHGNEFRAALDKYGKTYEWVVYRDEGHGLNRDENRFDFYRRVDAFLKKYLQ